MGTEYCLGRHGEDETPQGKGVFLMAYEMSGEFDVYADLPHHLVDAEAWENATRVNLWEHVSPEDLMRMGRNIFNIAKQELERGAADNPAPDPNDPHEPYAWVIEVQTSTGKSIQWYQTETNTAAESAAQRHMIKCLELGFEAKMFPLYKE